MRAALGLAPLAGLAFALVALAPAAGADPVVDCAALAPSAPSWGFCYTFWVEADPGHCLRHEDPGRCVAMMEFSCTLDAPPSRCGGALLRFGFR